MQSLRHLEKPLSSNGYLLSTAADRLGTLNPSPADLPIEIIRELFAVQGYVWLKGFFDKNDVGRIITRLNGGIVYSYNYQLSNGTMKITMIKKSSKD